MVVYIAQAKYVLYKKNLGVVGKNNWKEWIEDIFLKKRRENDMDCCKGDFHFLWSYLVHLKHVFCSVGLFPPLIDILW